ncbi:fam-h protein [Plasmodium relictum]|uniref:Fam-h protein n=1 Tax=Plasmodium relictum TaxID=85471 RepID=A0A1J1GKN8_PLARL|nr:fam-h protein [Plasmodium relictum]CRG85666.1 fam-h protein [Plasmodium relictum]
MTRYSEHNTNTAKSFNRENLLIPKMCYTTQKRNISFFLKNFFFTLLILILKYSINSTCEFCSNEYNLGRSLDLRVKRILSDFTHLLKENKSESKVNLLDAMEKENIPENKVQQKIARNISLTQTEGKIDIPDQSKNENIVNKNKGTGEFVCSIIVNSYLYVIVPALLFTLVILKELSFIPCVSDADLTNLFLMYISSFLAIIFFYMQTFHNKNK